MNTKLIINVIIFIILISLQYTLNLILKELKDIRRLIGREKTFTKGEGRD